MKLSMPTFYRDQWEWLPPVVRADLSNQTVVVIGANTGIGLEASIHFATMKPKRLIIACRSEGKGKEAVQEITKRTGYGSTELWLIDLSSFASVKAFADRFEREGGPLDILVMNAAVLPVKYEKSEDGWENALQVNNLSTSLLSLLLLPRMAEAGKKSGKASRLAIVSSDVHYWATIPSAVQEAAEPLKLLGSEEYCTATPQSIRPRYFETKLLNVLFTRALSDHLRPLPTVPVTPVAINPAYCWSQLRRDLKLDWGTWAFEWALARPSEHGARQLVFGALGNRDKEGMMRGAFVSKGTTQEVADWVLSDEGVRMQERIWEETIEILKEVDGRVDGIVKEYTMA
ncbi:short-chain dehydrogenase [Coniophora puteana RWD-64-598 SS2]|uniref:Short-chain dehydrogenase n=1 Tax=Coniophora puteana (strain RWD-64-598) TaxID=741705 RepID=A0A5M3M6Y8_CONPW|nr:short-chain dehydrogenase [Coniophora puteana RWD-64-598 SS2]EIW75019.1 short-chain dehydrogenase [Coniophora puteana RWD-64-598 SS2]